MGAPSPGACLYRPWAWLANPERIFQLDPRLYEVSRPMHSAAPVLVGRFERNLDSTRGRLVASQPWNPHVVVHGMRVCLTCVGAPLPLLLLHRQAAAPDSAPVGDNTLHDVLDSPLPQLGREHLRKLLLGAGILYSHTCIIPNLPALPRSWPWLVGRG